MDTLRSGFPTHLLDGWDDVRIRAAAAEVPAHRLLDVLVAVTIGLFQEGDGRHDLPRRAVTALEAVVRDKRSLHGMQGAGLPDAFNGRDRFVLVRHGETQARVHAASRHMDRA